MTFTVVDTDILIDLGRGEQDAADCLSRLKQEGSLAISVVTQMELMVGCRNKAEFNNLQSLLTQFQILNITEQISERAVSLLQKYRLSHGLLIADALIAATVLEYGESFISKNQRDFRFIAELQLLPYPMI